jgi:hypothetical protein
MGGDLKISPDRWWTASGGLFDWVVGWVANQVDNASLAASLQEIVDAHLGMLALEDLPDDHRRAVLKVLCERLVPAARAELNPVGIDLKDVLAHLQTLADMACVEGKPSSRTDQFTRHGADFGATSEEEYARRAAEFKLRSSPERIPTKKDPDGVTRMYDSQTNTFAVYNPDFTMRTFYKPAPARHGYSTNWDFWLAQPGSPPRWQ